MSALLTKIVAQALAWAGKYPEASDGRNTFVLFAQWVEGLRTTAQVNAAELVNRFEHESMALHKTQREWLIREIGAALSGDAVSTVKDPL